MKQGLSRRRFIFSTTATGAALVAGNALEVSAATMVDPASAQAKALGYAADATTVDSAKFPRYEAGQECANCQLYKGAADSESGACLLFAGQEVPAKAWCNSWVKKAG